MKDDDMTSTEQAVKESTKNNANKKQTILDLIPNSEQEYLYLLLTNKLSKERYWWINTNIKHELLYDHDTGLLWQGLASSDILYTEEAIERSKTDKTANLSDWQLPSCDDLFTFIQGDNPLRTGTHHRIENNRVSYWKTLLGSVNVDTCDGESHNGNHYFKFQNKQLKDIDIEHLFTFLLEKNWQLESSINSKIMFTIRNLISEHLVNSDFLRARLPKLDNATLTDENEGLWELFNDNSKQILQDSILVARDPVKDIKTGFVAIDFGTSSTVVAYQENGADKLLRIGVKDFWDEPKQADYENPTVLEFINLKNMLAAWQKHAYRPPVDWSDVCCSHEAQTHFRDNQTSPKVIGSILTKIKQWPLQNSEKDAPLRVTDQNNNHSLELSPLQLNQPVKGQALIVSSNDNFDPIELYAYFLGLNINWRGRGLFLNYLMSFPVDYPREIKEKILASFRRGLQRSLPESLISQEVFSKFSVEERASEPAAYAASALPLLGIDPTEEGEAYAVFDFGGGTTDFDFGFYRYATPEEEDKDGTEQVFEHFGAKGDRYLGGENLLDNIAYLTFKHNLAECRDNKISFIKPIDAKSFSGSEMFLEQNQAAQTNSLMMVTLLRPLWEADDLTEGSTQSLMLIDQKGDKKNCEFTIPLDELRDYLKTRIQTGVHSFYSAMKEAFSDNPPGKIHILLAGNSCKSSIVTELFNQAYDDITNDEVEHIQKSSSLNMNAGYAFEANNNELTKEKFESDQSVESGSDNHFLLELYQQAPPELIVHDPLLSDENNVDKATCKTGVALGLLNLCPGSATRVINHIAQKSKGEAPFAYHIGRERRKKFSIGISLGHTYHEWQELGPIRERIFHMLYSQSPLAGSGNLTSSDDSISRHRFDFAGNTDGHKVFAKAVEPNKIELCTAVSIEEINSKQHENQQVFIFN